MGHCNCFIKERIPPLTPATGKEFFDCHRGTTYEAFGILWDKMQLNIGHINHALDVIDEQLAANDLAAIEAMNNGQAAVLMATKAVDEASDLVNKHVHAADRKIAELTAMKVVLQDVMHDASEFMSMLKIKLERGDLNGKDGNTPVKGVDYFDGKDGKTPQKGVDYFDGRDGYTPIKGVDYNDGQDGKSAYELWLADGHTGTMQDYVAWLLAQGNVRTLINDLMESTVTNLGQRIQWLEENAVVKGEIIGGDEEDPEMPPTDDDPSESELEELKRRVAEQERVNEVQQEQIDANTRINDEQQESIDDEATDEDIDSLFS